MKYKVVNNFTDKHTGEKYAFGTVLELAQKRVKEINAKEAELSIKLIEKVEEPKVEEPEVEEPEVEE